MEIGFLVPWPLNDELTAYWAMWASVATALGTFLLAFYAWKAWQSAKQTLKGQQNSEQIAAVSKHVTALYALAEVGRAAPANYLPPATGLLQLDLAQRNAAYPLYVKQLKSEVEISGGLWRAYHSGSSGNLRPLVEGQDILLEAQDWRMNPPEGLASLRDDQFALNATFGRHLAQLIFEWQVREADRSSLSALIDHEVAKFIQDSPCNPGKATNNASQD